MAGDVPAQMDVAQLCDLHSIKCVGQIRYGNFYAARLIVQPLSSKTIHCTQKRCRSGRGRSSLEEVPAARIGYQLRGFGFVRGDSASVGLGFFANSVPAPDSLQSAHELDRKESKKGASKSNPDKRRQD